MRSQYTYRRVRHAVPGASEADPLAIEIFTRATEAQRARGRLRREMIRLRHLCRQAQELAAAAEQAAPQPRNDRPR